jgi:uroporphyrin-III C-methyltransferase/precorrin-2 dehydrogenase/sirohydrochlorin ferrochelatase
VKYFPVFFDLAQQPVLIVGGGEVALRKLSLLERTGARVTLVAPDIHPDILARAAAAPDALRLAQREFEPADLDGMRLVIIATSRRALNRWIAKLADGRGIPANGVDDREASRFIVPAIVDRDPVLVAVSTAGTSPVLARRLREKLEAFIPGRFGELALWLRDLRKGALEKLRDSAARRRYFESLVDGPAAQRLVEGDRRGAERIAQQLLAVSAAAPPARGEVTLVGAGPGDPELLTLKALRALQDADVILHDRLVSAAVLDMARRDALRISVGKAADGPSTPQAHIHALMIEHARAGKRVVRLKGGDPFIFGRGGEELQALAQAGIAFSVIPGITAAAGAAAYAGIPLTHREHAQSVSFVTGHADRDDKEPDWVALARAGHTAVFYMGLARLQHICSQLIAHGAPSERPAALVAQATTPQQRVLGATLATLPAAAAAATFESPALLVVGDVAALSAQLGWFATAAEIGEREAHRSA